MAHRLPNVQMWDAGFSEQGVHLSTCRGAAFRVALVGPAAGHRWLQPDLAEAARGYLSGAIEADVPLRVTTEHLEKLVRRADEAVRARLSVAGEGARATLLYATFRNGRLHTAHTGDACVLLLRAGELVPVAGRAGDPLPPLVAATPGLVPRRATLPRLPWIGRRRADDASDVAVETACRTAPTRLQPGDRVVLCSAPLSELEAVGGLFELLSFGDAESAAQTLRDLLQVRRGLIDVAVGVVDWPRERSAGTEAPPASELLNDELVAGFAEVLTALGEELDAAQAASETDEGAPQDPFQDGDDDDIFAAMATVLAG